MRAHLEDRLRLGAFSLGQWAQITTAAIAAALFGGYVSPLPAQATIFVSIIGAGVPVAISYGRWALSSPSRSSRAPCGTGAHHTAN